MRSNKRYTNTTFTKRVDHDGHREHKAEPEPAVCATCSAVRLHRRWRPADDAVSISAVARATPRLVECPTCRQLREGTPAGFVTLRGAFLTRHRSEIERLVHNEAERAAVDNPLARILETSDHDDGSITYATSTDHLAQRLGHAVEKSFGGAVEYTFSHENKLTRVSWRRD